LPLGIINAVIICLSNVKLLMVAICMM